VAPGKTATGNRFLFTGQEYFASMGLYNYRNRFYSASWGRFLQPDPIGFSGDSANLYRYCANNPVNLGDSDGLDAYPLPNGGGYYYGLQPGLNLKVLAGNPVLNPYYGKQCGVAGQYWAGTMKGGFVHDVPSTTTWSRGAPVSGDLQYGTLIATGWTPDGGYPSRSQQSYNPGETINHVALFVEDLGDGNIVIFEQGKDFDPRFNTVKKDGWYVVNGKDAYDKAKTDSYIAWRTAGLAAIQRYGAATARAIYGRIDGLAFAESIDGFQTWSGLGDVPVGGASPSDTETFAQP
jgi:RHS repeat-associated protein